MRTRSLAVSVCVALACGAWACGPGPQPRNGAAMGYRGSALDPPLEKPDFTLTDTEGEAFDFRTETEGRVTLLFFGYTHCPDVCPVHMANLGAVLGRLPYDIRRRVAVVFVTTDPARDTGERIRDWLDNFDPAFVGLRGEPERIDSIQRRLGFPPAMRPGTPESESGDYTVGHAASVLAFTPDGRAHLRYPFGTRQVDWAHDLPKLVLEGPDER